jgi:hypothetical protein
VRPGATVGTVSLRTRLLPAATRFGVLSLAAFLLAGEAAVGVLRASAPATATASARWGVRTLSLDPVGPGAGVPAVSSSLLASAELVLFAECRFVDLPWSPPPARLSALVGATVVDFFFLVSGAVFGPGFALRRRM